MAQLIERAGSFQVKWRLGGRRGATWQSETFHDKYSAGRFKLDVEQAGHEWPEGWVKGYGFMSPEQLAVLQDEERASNGTPFAKFAQRRRESQLAAQDIGPDQFKRYRQLAGAFERALPIALQLTEVLEGDDELRLKVLQDPTSAASTLESLSVQQRSLMVEDVDKDAISAWVTWMRVRGALPKTIANHHGFLYGVFQEAAEDGLILRNPCIGTKIGKKVKSRLPVILEREEFFLIHQAMPADSKDFVEAAVGTGMRFGELTALTVGDYNRFAKTASVNKAWKRGLVGHEIGTPKTAAGERTVWLSDPVAEIFDKHVAGKAGHELIFTAPRGGRIRQNVFGESRWRTSVARARFELGLTKDPKFHDLRHTHISWLRDDGLPDVAIKDLVGHAAEAMTGRYGGVTAVTIERARAAMASSLSRPSAA